MKYNPDKIENVIAREIGYAIKHYKRDMFWWLWRVFGETFDKCQHPKSGHTNLITSTRYAAYCDLERNQYGGCGEYGEVVRHIVNGQYCQAWAAAGPDDKKVLGRAINKLLAKGQK